MTTLDVMADDHTVPVFFHLLEVNWVKCAFQSNQASDRAYCSQAQTTTRPVFGTQSSTKQSTKLHAYFLSKIRNPSLHAESREGIRGTTNVLGMTVLNSASVATTVQSSREPPKVWQGVSLLRRSKQMANNVVYTVLNGDVKEVTRHLGRSIIWNGQTVPKLSKTDFFCALPFDITIYGNMHNINFAHNQLMVQGLM